MQIEPKREGLVFQTLHAKDFPVLYQSFTKAFADYQTNVSLTKEAFQYRLHRMGYVPEFSAGAFSGEEMVGFILTGLGSFSGKRTAYNGGTGVLPAFRGQGIARSIYTFLFPVFQEAGVEAALLEVIDNNTPAIKLYGSLGFQERRSLACFSGKLPGGLATNPLKGIRVTRVEEPDFLLYGRFAADYNAWQNTNVSIGRTLADETVLEAFYKGETIGFISFHAASGKLSQIAVAPAFRKMGVGRVLLSSAAALSIPKQLVMLNIDVEQMESIGFLKACGLNEFLVQKEMVKVF